MTTGWVRGVGGWLVVLGGRWLITGWTVGGVVMVWECVGGILVWRREEHGRVVGAEKRKECGGVGMGAELWVVEGEWWVVVVGCG